MQVRTRFCIRNSSGPAFSHQNLPLLAPVHEISLDDLVERVCIPELLEWVKEDKLKACVNQVFPLDKAIDCHNYLESRKIEEKFY